MARKRYQAHKRGCVQADGEAARAVADVFEKAVRCYNSGEFEESRKLCRGIIAHNHYHTDSLHLLGIVEAQMGNLEEALSLISKAVRIKNNVPFYHNSLGNVFKALGRYNEAIPCYRRAIFLAPNHAEPYNNLGCVFSEQGKENKAIECYRKALALRPDYVEALLNLGRVFNEKKNCDEAIKCFRRALELRPDYAAVHFNMGIALKMSGDPGAALSSFRAAVSLDPGNAEHWAHMARTLESIKFNAVDDSLIDDLDVMLQQKHVHSGVVCRPILSALKCHPVFVRKLRQFTGDARETTAEHQEYARAAEDLSAIPLFVRLISLTAVVEPDVEEMLTRLRRLLLQAVCKGGTENKGLNFSAALAQQCFINEYVFEETPEETAAVDFLVQKLKNFVDNGQEIPSEWLIALAAYRPLHSFPWLDDLHDAALSEETKAVVVQQVIEPREEKSLRITIPRLTEIQDETSKIVRAQYEENPYPRWIRPRTEPVSLPVKRVMQSIFPHKDFSKIVFPERPEILIAGSGTGEHALTVFSRFSGARVLAIDLSLGSIAYAIRKARELGIRGIDFAQADILEMGGIGRRFDIIDSSGVLHHLRDPMKGWRILVELLQPWGFMKIALYSELARQPVVKARAFIEKKGYLPTAKDIRRCRQEILSEKADPVVKEITGFRDFYSLSECRDLLFHVQEHRFSLLQIEAAMDELGLEFIGFELDNQMAMNKFIELYCDTGALSSLRAWHAFEQQNPATFRGMYQFWCRKKQQD